MTDSTFKLGNFSVDEARPMKVVAIGAGYSGIVAGIRFRQRVPNMTFTMYDSNAGVGGTWFVNKYPGLACDIPAHCYQLTFEPNPNWSAFFAPGPEIQQYLEGVVDKYKLRPYIQLRHRLTSAIYSESEGKWHLRIRRPKGRTAEELADPEFKWDWRNDYEEFDDWADVLFSGQGCLSRWSWPEIEGLHTFKGKLVHSAEWNTGEGLGEGWRETVKNWGDKKVGVIGVGSSAIQIVPALQPRVKHLVNYVRGQTWLAGPFVKERLSRLAGGKEVSNYTFTEEDKKNFKDPEYYHKFRWELESELNSAHATTIKNSDVQAKATADFKANMRAKLAKKPWIADSITPDFAVGCRRLTPGPGYLEALCEDNVDFVSSRIQTVTPNGIQTVDGKHQDLDIIVTATGFETSFRFDFPVLGRNGVDLSDKYNPHPKTYLAVTVDGFPNWFMSLGPNSAVGTGSLLLLIERQVDYAVAATLKMQRERIKSMDVKAEAVEDFDQYLESYFPTTVFSEKCRSWYKVGKEEGRVVALWPGSPLHAARSLTHPRWEDYNFEYFDGIKNRFHWLGDGHAVADRDPKADKAFYLSAGDLDIPPVPEN